MKKIFFALLISTINSNIHATKQIPDLLLIGNDTIYLSSFPLEVLQLKYRPFGLTPETAPSTGCHRGYHAVWRLINDTLCLEKILSCEWDGTSKEENIIELFKKNSMEKYILDGKVEALWYDKILFRSAPVNSQYYRDKIWLTPAAYKRPYEDDIMLQFSKGVLIINRLKEYKNFRNNVIHLFRIEYSKSDLATHKHHFPFSTAINFSIT